MNFTTEWHQPVNQDYYRNVMLFWLKNRHVFSCPYTFALALSTSESFQTSNYGLASKSSNMSALQGHRFLHSGAMSDKEKSEGGRWRGCLTAMAFKIYVVPLKEGNRSDQIGRFKETLEINATVPFTRQNDIKPPGIVSN